MENKTVVRNWLQEAHEISARIGKHKPKKEHIDALVAQLRHFAANLDLIEKKMTDLYDKECKVRKEQGLTPPAAPPSMKVS